MTPGPPAPPAGAASPRGAWLRVRPVPAWRVWIWGLAYWLALAPPTYLPPRLSGNVFSRYMAIEAMVERGTLAIERSPLLARSGSPDVVQFGPHLYSDKPPVLPALAAPLYAGMRLAGFKFGGPIRDFLLSNFVLTWGTAGLASALCLVALRALLQGVDIAPGWADLLTVAFGLGSPLLTYAVTFNNHSVAAGCVAGAWSLTLLAGTPRRAAGSGVLAGLASTIDLPAGLLTLASLGLIQAARGGRPLAGYALGAAGPLALHAGLQSAITGTPLPAEMYPAAFEYPGSYWTTPEGAWHETGPRWRFGLDLLVGRQGAFTVFPPLWFGVGGLLAALAGRSSRSRRGAALLVLGALLVLVGYYTWGVRRTDFAGASWGVRHLLAIEPMVFLFAAAGLARVRGPGRWVAGGGFVAALAVATVFAVAGLADPWSRVERRAGAERWVGAVDRLALYRHGTFRDGGPPARPGRTDR